ncbi:MAG: hypothetical protein K6T29_01540 [Peptococcaceae bacterium]|nr:hypothetical protein [Peptococcaceae bacterium]
MFKKMALLAAVSALLTAGSGFALLLGSSATKGHVVLGLITVLMILSLARLVHRKT